MAIVGIYAQRLESDLLTLTNPITSQYMLSA